MKEIDVLRELFDEKIISIINIFIENPNRNLSLSEISEMAKVNVATTFRIVNKLVKKEYVKVIVIGKSKFYQVKSNPKTITLFKFLKKDDDKISDFIDGIKKTGVSKIILESQDKKEAKFILVGNSINKSRIEEVSKKIEASSGFKIKFAEMNEKQFKEIADLDLYDLNKKIVWEATP